jgi:VanZ family protein
MNDRIRMASRFGPKLRGLVWLIYTVAWTVALLTPQPVDIADAALNPENAFYASKALHVSAYALLAILSGWLNAPLPWRWLLLAFMSTHALGTEFFQRFVANRYPSWTDVGWDHIGIVWGLILSWRWWAE